MNRLRAWINSPYHNFNDRKALRLTPDEVLFYTLFEEAETRFSYNDGVDSEVICEAEHDFLNSPPNYMILKNGTEIESRWFVINIMFISGEPTFSGKYLITLKRDVIVDFIDEIKANHIKCERGTLPNTYNPLIFQNEGLNVNKIKVAQIPLKDLYQDTRWLTIFYDSKASINLTWDDSMIQIFSNITQLRNDFQYSSIPLGTNYSLTKFNYVDYIELEQSFTLSNGFSFVVGLRVSKTNGISNIVRKRYYPNTTTGNINTGLAFTTFVSEINRITNGISMSTFENNVRNVTSSNLDNSNLFNEMVTKYNNRNINDGTQNNIYNLQFTTTDSVTEYNGTVTFSQVIPNYSLIDANFANPTNPLSVYRAERVHLNFLYTRLYANTYNLVLPSGKKTYDSNISIFTVPFDGLPILTQGNTLQSLSPNTIYGLATSAFLQGGSSVYDVQLLPYCPSSELIGINSANPINISADAQNLLNLRTPITNINGGTAWYGFNLRDINISSYIETNILSYFTQNLKLDDISKSVRIVSHNHSSSYEFSPIRNNYNTNFTLKITLRPNNTQIACFPSFDQNSVYGGNYQDDRGLIYEGGFSVTRTSSEWINFVLQNSTYNSTFNRTIKNMDITQNNERAIETKQYQLQAYLSKNNRDTKLISDLLNSGGQLGYGLFGLLNGGLGAVDAANAFGHAELNANKSLEVAKSIQSNNDAVRNENINYKTDIFKFDIQAIKARPDTLQQTTQNSFINFGKIYLEIYDCSEAEKELISLFIEYNGMAIGKTGYLTEFVDPSKDLNYFKGIMVFLKGGIPRINNEINAVMNGGIYIMRDLYA